MFTHFLPVYAPVTRSAVALSLVSLMLINITHTRTRILEGYSNNIQNALMQETYNHVLPNVQGIVKMVPHKYEN